jgi:ABC-type nickel/cobalt efflux system permease component RcnA
MLKKFVFVLLAMFAFQLCWAVVSAYCLHETDVKAQHFGHHTHQHTAKLVASSDATGEHSDIRLCAKHDSKLSEIHGHDHAKAHAHAAHDTDSDTENASFHADCGSCAHSPFGHCAGNSFSLIASLVNDQMLASSPVPNTPFLAQPERPKWQAVA